MGPVEELIRRYGGIASARDLRWAGIPREWVRVAVNYGRVLHICHGWFANLDAPPDAIEARRVGGRLACVSALKHHGALGHHGALEQTDSALHIAVPRWSSRLRTQATVADVVVHWYRREPAGDGIAVSAEEALAQRARCRALRQ